MTSMGATSAWRCPGCPALAPRRPCTPARAVFAYGGSDEGRRSELPEFCCKRASSTLIRASSALICACCCWSTSSRCTTTWGTSSGVCSNWWHLAEALLEAGENSPPHPLMSAIGGFFSSQVPTEQSASVISAPLPPPMQPPPGAARRSSPWRGTGRWRWIARRGPVPAGRSWQTACRGRGGSGRRAGDDIGQRGVEVGRFRQRIHGVAGIVRTHGA